MVLDQAAMLEAAVHDDGPAFAQLQQKIDARLARAQGVAELGLGVG
jgi:hypothetical protein